MAGVSRKAANTRILCLIWKIRRLAPCFILALLGSASLPALTPPKPPEAPAQLRIIMTVDWEGDDLLTENIKAMTRLRQDFPDIPFLHYLNAAYFTKPQSNASKIYSLIQKTLLPQDQFGVHLHAWKSLVEAAGVVPRLKPSWVRRGRPGSTEDCRHDCGYEIPINAYSYEELGRILATSKSILAKQGYSGLKHFRAGGWVTGPQLLEALAAEGFITDSSAVPINLVADELLGMDLLSWLRFYWKDISTRSQPYQVATARGSLWQVPNNAALADYMKAEESLTIVEEALKQLKPGKPYTIVAGFHQETADDWSSRVRSFLKALGKLRREQNAPIVFTVMPETF